MSKKRTRLILVMSAICIAIGGMIMFGFHRMSEEEKLQAQIRKEQERMALYAVNHYEGIEKIEFFNFEKNNMTGFWSADGELNGEYQVTFKSSEFGGDLWINRGSSKIDGSYLKVREQEDEILDISQIEVIYFEGGS
ncbi:TPA: hypothetical protein ACGOXP_001734 [Streptococcus suis]